MKERIFGFLFKGMREEDFDNICRAFAHNHLFLLRPKGIKRINDALNEGAEFTYSLAGLNGRDVTHTLNLCRMLREVDFLASYAYRRAPHYKIVARVNRSGKGPAVSFCNV